ncbi:MAG: GNAT family N-acetyltransferase [Coriobacteriales bacterium]|nr:GNAT family N-acetyltransferase [Coriobacteriales bacterium]
MQYIIRQVEPKYNRAIEVVIRSCLVEFGANHEGTAWADPYLGRFSEVYAHANCAYWVAIDETGEVVGGVGVGPLEGVPEVCELQKMYCLPKARGTGIAQRLLSNALDFAANHYERIYLETLDNMIAAQRFYEKHGFERIHEPLGNTGHHSCDVLYIRELKTESPNQPVSNNSRTARSAVPSR